MSKKQEEGLVGITAEEFNETRQKQFNETVYVVSKKIVSEINKRLKEFGKISYEDVCSQPHINVKELVPNAIISERSIFKYDFIRHFNAQSEVGSKRCILFNAIWDAVRNKLEGWDIKYKYHNLAEKSILELSSNFNPQNMITAKDFGGVWQSERDKMLQFFVDASMKCINDACGTTSLKYSNIYVDNIIYHDDQLMISSAEGIEAFKELKKKMSNLGWVVRIHCKKESFENNLYPNRKYSIHIEPS